MEWKSNLWRTQSLSSIQSPYDKPTWIEAGWQDKKASVSQLVARYQTAAEVRTSIQANSINTSETKPQQVLKQDTHRQQLMRRNDERERSQAKTNLSRSKSMGSLQNSTGSIEVLRALFESKATMQNKVKSSFRTTKFTSPYKAADMPVINREGEELKNTAEEPKNKIPADASVNTAKTAAKEDHVTRKVVNQTRAARRKTIGGIDFERIAASQNDEKRRSLADFRDSSFLQTKEKLYVSVKAMSALYLSKVAPQEPNRPLKPAQDQSSESGKKVKLSKMAEDSQERQDDFPPPPSARHQPGPEDVSGAHSQQCMPSQLSREKLYQQRQKCELRRLLKHTHPELKMLGEAVDEEFAEVLSSEAGVTAGETGYEGEVLSRCLIFENCALSNKVSPYNPKMCTAEGTAETRDASKQSAVSEKQEERLCNESVTGIVEDDKMLGSSPYSNREEEEKIRIDVQATRRIFESQAVNTSRVNPNEKFQGKVSISGDETGAVPKQKQQFEMCSQNDQHSKNISSDTDVAKQPHKHGSCAHVVGQSINRNFSGREEASTGETGFEDDPTSLLSPEGFEEMIKTSADLFNNNPFISTNIERENSHVHKSMPQIRANPNGSSEDSLITNVKNRAHLFESMPFDKIRHQNQDEIETMVENIKETLNSLYLANAIHSNGSIIEVNETMIAKKAKFSLSENGPKIKYDEVAEGGTQNFILQLLPRANLKPQITYLKEDSKGRMEVTVINVPLHHHQFITSQDTQFKTANVVQLVEDILNQDNSLRKGVIIEEDENNSAEIIVYSLYNYFDEENVKSYCPPQGHGAECDKPETDRIVMSKTKNQGVRKDVKSETSQDQTCSGSIRPEEKGNVKLFTSCIEKGDLEYLKTLQAVPAVLEQEPPLSQTVVGQGTKPLHEQRGDQAEDSSAEWAPVDVKRLKCLFSGHQRQTQAKQNCHEKHGQSVTVSKAITGQNVPLEKNQSSTECNVGVFAKGQVKTTFREEGNSATIPQGSYLHLETQDCDTVQQAELVETVDDNDEISCLQTAIHSLKQATGKVKSLPHSSQNKQSVQASEELEEPPVSVTADDLKHSRTEAELPQGNEDEKVDSCTELRLDPSTSCCTSKHKTELQHENIEIHPEETNSEKVQTTQTGSMNGQKGVDVVQEYCEDVVHCSEMTSDQQEEILQGKLKAALQSLERSNMNVTRGDFRAAMIYRNASKPCKKSSQNVGAVSVQKSTMEVFCPVTETTSTQVPLRQELPKGEVTATNAEPQSQREALNRPGVSEKTKSPTGSKPTIPPKPEHLKVKQRDSQSDSTKKPKATQMATLRPEVKMLSKDKTFPQPAKSVLYMDEFMKEPSKINRGSDSGVGSKTEAMSPESQIRPLNKNVFNHSEMKNAEEIGPQNFPVQDNTTDTDESHINFHEACQKFGGKKKNAPVKPKEIKTAQSDTKNLKNTHGDNNSPISTHVDTKPRQTLTDPLFSTCEHTADINERHKKESKQENKVEMREKKGRTETEDERRQRLSVHMDEIMRGNITAAMEIMDNLRKQEELQGILSQVEQIEQDTSKADVRSLRTVRENMSDWVVSSNIEKQRKVQVEPREKLTKDITESKSAMAHVFVDLERASEEIMNLKEQTLARLMDIEEAIKKALYSVSTLKSDSDIAGLSRLFKESLGAVEKSPPSGNISKISIGSNRTKPPQAQESPDMKKIKSLSAGQGAGTETVSGNQPASPPSSPAFISIHSATRKTERTPAETAICPTCQHNLKTEEKFRTTKTLTCHNPALNRNSDPRKEGQKQSTYRAKQNPFVGGTD